MASNIPDAMVQALEEVDRLRGELATVARERDEAVEALRPFVRRDITSDKLWILQMVMAKDYLPARRFLVDHDERQRIDSDVMLNGLDGAL